MKAWVQTTPYFENEVVDVYLCIEPIKQLVWVKGFDEDEWEQAQQLALDVASALGLEYLGEVGEAGYETPWSEQE